MNEDLLPHALLTEARKIVRGLVQFPLDRPGDGPARPGCRPRRERHRLIEQRPTRRLTFRCLVAAEVAHHGPRSRALRAQETSTRDLSCAVRGHLWLRPRRHDGTASAPLPRRAFCTATAPACETPSGLKALEPRCSSILDSRLRGFHPSATTTPCDRRRMLRQAPTGADPKRTWTRVSNLARGSEPPGRTVPDGIVLMTVFLGLLSTA